MPISFALARDNMPIRGVPSLICPCEHKPAEFVAILADFCAFAKIRNPIGVWGIPAGIALLRGYILYGR